MLFAFPLRQQHVCAFFILVIVKQKANAVGIKPNNTSSGLTVFSMIFCLGLLLQFLLT